jgi:hypothetical protein
MNFDPAPLYTTRIRPLELALLIKYIEEASCREKSRYLSGFLEYLHMLVFDLDLDQNMSSVRKNHLLEQAEAILAEIRQKGEPHFWSLPDMEES